MELIFNYETDVKIKNLLSKAIDDKNPILHLTKILMSKDKTCKILNDILDDIEEMTKNKETIYLYNIIHTIALINKNERKQITNELKFMINSNLIEIEYLSQMTKTLKYKKNKNIISHFFCEIQKTKHEISKEEKKNVLFMLCDLSDEEIIYIINKIKEIEKNYDLNFNVKNFIAIYAKNKNKNFGSLIENSLILCLQFDKLDLIQVFECLTNIGGGKKTMKLFVDFINKCEIDNYNYFHISNLIFMCDDLCLFNENKIISKCNLLFKENNVKLTKAVDVITLVKNICYENTELKINYIFEKLKKISENYSEIYKSVDISVILTIAKIVPNKLYAIIQSAIELKKKLIYIDIEDVLEDILYIFSKDVKISNLNFIVSETSDFINSIENYNFDIREILKEMKILIDLYNGKMIIKELKNIISVYKKFDYISFISLISEKKYEDCVVSILSNISKIFQNIDKINEETEDLNRIFTSLTLVKNRQNIIADLYRQLVLSENINITKFVVENVGKRLSVSDDVHQNASINMKNNFEFMYYELKLKKYDLMSLNECINHIIDMIQNLEEIDVQNFKINDTLTLSNLKVILQEFLTCEKFNQALQVNFSNFNDEYEYNITGEILFRTSVSYIYHNPSMTIAFLVQGLWDSIIAYGSDDLRNISCTNGVSERFVMWVNYIDEEKEFIEKIKKDIYFDEKYEKMYYFDDEENFEFIQKEFGNSKTLHEFKKRIKKFMLKLHDNLKYKFEIKYEKKLDKVFLMKEIQDLFFVFEEDNKCNELRFEEIYEKIKNS